MRQIRYLCLVLFSLLTACGDSAISSRMEITGQEKLTRLKLKEAIISYYIAESEGNWRKTYQSRTSKFIELVPYDVYQKEMDAGAHGWNLVRIDIIESHLIKEFFVNVKIRFVEKIVKEETAKKYGFDFAPVIARFTENTLWEKRGSGWKCLEAGQRLHFPLNDRVVY